MRIGYLHKNKELAISLWQQGLSYTEMAEKIGHGVTRGAVAGFCRRQKLVRLPEDKKPKRKPKQKVAIRKPQPAYKKEIILQQEPKLLHIQELSIRTCRWPLGDPKDGNFFYCGVDIRDGSAYCEFHDRMAHKPADKKIKPKWPGRLTRQWLLA